MKFAATLIPAAVLTLAACGQKDPNAAALENAARQSTPEAAAVLENAAESGANVQDAMQAAGNAQAPVSSNTAAPATGAKPHAPGDPVPPPQVSAGGNSQ
jgi:predicted small lipoprotein YifL